MNEDKDVAMPFTNEVIRKYSQEQRHEVGSKSTNTTALRNDSDRLTGRARERGRTKQKEYDDMTMSYEVHNA